MTERRVQITMDEQVFKKLKRDKRQGMTWTLYLELMHEAYKREQRERRNAVDVEPLEL